MMGRFHIVCTSGCEHRLTYRVNTASCHKQLIPNISVQVVLLYQKTKKQKTNKETPIIPWQIFVKPSVLHPAPSSCHNFSLLYIMIKYLQNDIPDTLCFVMLLCAVRLCNFKCLFYHISNLEKYYGRCKSKVHILYSRLNISRFCHG